MNNIYIIKDKFIAEKNVDRTRFFTENKVIQACYHLENGKKTGIIYQNEITSEYKFNLQNKKYFDYGILDIKFDEQYFFTSNSNSSFSILSYSLEKLFNFKISNDENNTCNTLDMNDQSILLAMNDGTHCLYDLNSKEVVFSSKAHEYGLWSIYWYNENIYLTGSEDSVMKFWDKRVKE
jgi:hypothetical protein